jgi:alpha-mannosidase II
MIDRLPFDNPYGGDWNRGLNSTYQQKQWDEHNKLYVIIVPHSHNDPGWLMTFDEYFETKSKDILNTIVTSLTEKITRKFIWAEISFLSLWWTRSNKTMRAKMKRLIVETKQLEIVTGGWVMTDEANAHYYAMIEQMIEGHEWLSANIDSSLQPNYGWSIDTFGHSPTMAYLLKQMGFEAMVIQRIHYHLKKHLAQSNDLEFKWKQHWPPSTGKDNSILTHVMPFSR